MKVKLWFEGGEVTHHDIAKMHTEAKEDYLVLEDIVGRKHNYPWSSVVDMWTGPEDESPHRCMSGED